MENMDYYTVMESRIKYFEKKYDPNGKFSKKAEPFPKVFIPVKKENPIKKQWTIVLNSVIAFLF
jgi:hypothetical protein